jgi:adenine/guanine phosphoribosyltransferase-like PRPP-binding protein
MPPVGRDAVLHLLQDNPVVIDVARAPVQASRDISVDVVLGIFAVAGAFLLAAAVGSALVAGVIILLKRWREKSAPSADASEPTHTRLGI